MKLFFLFISAALLSFGWFKAGERFAIAGALLFILIEAIDLALIYRSAKLFRADDWKPDEKRGVIKTMSDVVRGLIVFAGLFSMLSGHASGTIIWVGTIICWLLAGWITREVVGIPLKMGYGGWYVQRKKSRHRK
jgi:predicted ABC-type exoprotein transport system permease subunit